MLELSQPMPYSKLNVGDLCTTVIKTKECCSYDGHLFDYSPLSRIEGGFRHPLLFVRADVLVHEVRYKFILADGSVCWRRDDNVGVMLLGRGWEK